MQIYNKILALIEDWSEAIDLPAYRQEMDELRVRSTSLALFFDISCCRPVCPLFLTEQTLQEDSAQIVSTSFAAASKCRTRRCAFPQGICATCRSTGRVAP